MVVTGSNQVNQQLEEERRLSLRTANVVRRPAPIPPKRLYREEHGCQQEDHSHNAKAITSLSNFNAAIL
ncbi:hypothetical protein CGCVW01_v013205 [Colletotrichum viniferum]|nr:hypothetical protein CGCVW01_v013205 [Colletotrichum viniferum]